MAPQHFSALIPGRADYIDWRYSDPVRLFYFHWYNFNRYEETAEKNFFFLRYDKKQKENTEKIKALTVKD